jgi:two-component system, NarL family, nitrate/nitrite response regulator NarL
MLSGEPTDRRSDDAAGRGRPIRVVIADDHPLFRDALSMALRSEPDIEVVGEAADGEEAVVQALALRPDVLLLDLQMPRLTGLGALAAVSTTAADVKAVLLTASISRYATLEAIQRGARGILTKDAEVATIIRCVRDVAAGGYWVGHGLVGDLVTAIRDAAGAPGDGAVLRTLTPREVEIIAIVRDGGTNDVIAERFGVTRQTVKNSLTRIYDKLGVSNRIELALFAAEHHLASPEDEVVGS